MTSSTNTARSTRAVSSRQILAMCALLVGVIASVLWGARIRDARVEERDDLDLFLDASSAGWAEVTDLYFKSPELVAQTIGALEGRMDSDAERIALLAESIRGSDALDGAFVGRPDGSFVFVARSDDRAPGGFRTRTISFEDAVRTVELTWTDADMTVVHQELDEADTYDPRQRPWYDPIAMGDDTSWTEPYVFASSQQPGITHSSGVTDASGKLRAVVGIDIRLTALANFLDELRPGINGEALVVDDQARLIAASSISSIDPAAQGGVVLEPLADSVELVGLINKLADPAVEVVSRRSNDGARTTVTRTAGSSDHWFLVVRAFDQDFLGDTSMRWAPNLLGVVAVGLATMAVVILSGLVSIRYWESLRSQADVDELTGLMSRRAIKQHLRTVLANDANPLWVAIVDLDKFKSVNDEHGHLVGDAVLAEVGHRMSGYAGEYDACAGRLGGDEFVIAADRPLDWDVLLKILAAPLHHGGQRFPMSATFGVAERQAHHLTVEDLLSDADRALFAAKRARRGTYLVAG